MSTNLKIKFGIRIEFYKTQGTNYLVAKKNGDSNEFLTKICNPSLILPVFFILVFFFSIQPFFTKTHVIKLYFGFKIARLCKNKLMIKIKIFKNYTIVIHIKM